MSKPSTLSWTGTDNSCYICERLEFKKGSSSVLKITCTFDIPANSRLYGMTCIRCGSRNFFHEYAPFKPWSCVFLTATASTRRRWRAAHPNSASTASASPGWPRGVRWGWRGALRWPHPGLGCRWGRRCKPPAWCPTRSSGWCCSCYGNSWWLVPRSSSLSEVKERNKFSLSVFFLWKAYRLIIYLYPFHKLSEADNSC